MTIYKIPTDLSDYHGAGKAWAAIAGDHVLALRYMGEHPIPGCGDYDVPAWVRAVTETATGLDASNLPTCHGSHALAAVAAAAQACDDCPTPPRRDRYRPSELLTMARATLVALDGDSFTAYRDRCRAELAKFGDVESGVASCYEFIT